MNNGSALPLQDQNSSRTAQSHKDAQDGWTAYSQHEMLQAEEAFRRAFQYNPDDLDSLFALGLVLHYSGKNKEAIEVFNQVINNLEYQESSSRNRMVRNLSIGHIHQIETGDWNLEKEIWSRK